MYYLLGNLLLLMGMCDTLQVCRGRKNGGGGGFFHWQLKGIASGCSFLLAVSQLCLKDLSRTSVEWCWAPSLCVTLSLKKIFFLIYFIYLFFSVLGLCYCMGFSLVVASGSHSPAMVLRFLFAVASLVAKHWLLGTRAPVVETPGLSSCGSWALEHRLNICGTQA